MHFAYPKYQEAGRQRYAYPLLLRSFWFGLSSNRGRCTVIDSPSVAQVHYARLGSQEKRLYHIVVPPPAPDFNPNHQCHRPPQRF